MTLQEVSRSLPIVYNDNKQYIFYLGNEFILIATQTNVFHSRFNLKKYIIRKYLKHYPKGKPINCPHPKYSITFPNLNQLKNYVKRAYKTLT